MWLSDESLHVYGEINIYATIYFSFMDDIFQKDASPSAQKVFYIIWSVDILSHSVKLSTLFSQTERYNK